MDIPDFSPDSLPGFLFELSELARQNEQAVYLVGGAVRDLLLGEKIYDFDILCSHNAIELAQKLESVKFAKVISVHEQFGTAKISLNPSQDNQTKIESEIELDLATTRKESYEFPGALPKAEYPCTVEEDLKRRDFTINSIALQILNEETKFVDPFNGREDLQNKTIRVLHSQSYLEDPTRIIRAVRFATRFGYKLSEADVEQIISALKDERLLEMTKRLRGLRFGIELKRLFELPSWLKGIEQLSELGAWDIVRKELIVCSQETAFELLSWASKLAWVLWNNESELENIMKELGVSASFSKQAKKARKILNLLNLPEAVPTLSLYQEINSLPEDLQNILFSLNAKVKDVFLKMKKALPKEKPEDLMKKGFKGKEIADELERIFRSNFQIS